MSSASSVSRWLGRRCLSVSFVCSLFSQVFVCIRRLSVFVGDRRSWPGPAGRRGPDPPVDAGKYPIPTRSRVGMDRADGIFNSQANVAPLGRVEHALEAFAMATLAANKN